MFFERYFLLVLIMPVNIQLSKILWPAAAAAFSHQRPALLKSGRLSAERPEAELVGLGRVELPTSPLSGVRSSHLSYRPFGRKLVELVGIEPATS